MTTDIPKSFVFDENAPKVKSFLANASSYWKMKLFMLYQLPSLFFWGVRVHAVSTEECKVSIPFRWLSQNPFGSTYFAAMGGTAELSTGLLAMLYLQGRGKVSMYVTNFEMQYRKKATGRTYFTCVNGAQINEAITLALQTGEGQEFTAESIGRNEKGDVIARAKINWSFKKK